MGLQSSINVKLKVSEIAEFFLICGVRGVDCGMRDMTCRMRGKFSGTKKTENKDIFIKCYIYDHILWPIHYLTDKLTG